jgi:hypothetical protein
MSEEAKVNFLKEYRQQQTQNQKNAFLAQYQEDPEAMGLVNAYNKINKNNFLYNPESNRNKEHQMINKAIQNQQANMGQSVNNSGRIANNSGRIANNSGQIANNSGQIATQPEQTQPEQTQPEQTQPENNKSSLFSGIGLGGKKSKSKSKSKAKPKAKKSTKGRK